MARPHQLDVIQYVRSSYYYDNVYVLQYDELESLKEELKMKEKEVEELQSVKLSQAFTDHSVTPESSLMNVGASFSEKVRAFPGKGVTELGRNATFWGVPT